MPASEHTRLASDGRTVTVQPTDKGIRVAVRYPPSGMNNWPTDYPATLTPEEALLLIFRLVKAVDQALTPGHDRPLSE